jgi:hypothetical protein
MAWQGKAWQGQLIAVYSPFWQHVSGRSAMITPQQYRLVARVLPGWQGNQRDLAASLGYSLAGLNEAITTLSKLGILARLTRRGRLGWTRLVMVRGVHLENVRHVVEHGISRFSSLVRTVVPNISRRAGDDGSLDSAARGDGGGLWTGALDNDWGTGLPEGDHRQAVPAR